MQQQGVLILGMHRSGTSAMAGVLQKLGYNLGFGLLPAAADNPTGFFEISDVTNLNEQMLFENSTTWDDPRPVPIKIPEKTFGLIFTVWEREFGRSPFWALKDPRLSLFAQPYRSALEARGVRTSAILMLRHPMDVAASLFARDGITEIEAANLWLKYTLRPLKELAHNPPAIVFYDRLVEDPKETLRVGQLVNAPMLERAFEIDNFLSAGRRHHRSAERSSDIGMQAAVLVYDKLVELNAARRKIDADAIVEFETLLQGVETDRAYANYAPRKMKDVFRLAVHFFHAQNSP